MKIFLKVLSILVIIILIYIIYSIISDSLKRKNNTYPTIPYKKCDWNYDYSDETASKDSTNITCKVSLNESFVLFNDILDRTPRCIQTYIIPSLMSPGGCYRDGIDYNADNFSVSKIYEEKDCEDVEYYMFTPKSKGTFYIQGKGSCGYGAKYKIIVN